MTTVLDKTVGVPDSAQKVLSLLREQASMYGRLQAIADRQRALVANEDAGPLLSLLADRRKLSESLTQISDRLDPVRRAWSTYREQLAPPERAEAERLLRETSERLRRVIESDEEDVRVLCGRKQAVAEALRATHVTSQAISAYRLPVKARGRLDCTSGDA